MKKTIWLVFGALFSSLLFSSVPASASVNDFVITRYDIHYTLGRDSDKRSTLTTEETIVAEFADIDQNHGIERYIPRDYDGHSTSLDVQSVTDQNGKSWNYTTYTSDEYEVVRIGDADRYVRGEQTFKIIYTQRDVTRHFTNTEKDEFYWDTNGTEWRVPIQNLSVTLTVDENIRAAQFEEVACYKGKFGETTPCQIQEVAGTTRASGDNLTRGENVTLALGFAPGTFAAYEMSLGEKVFIGWLALQVVCLLAMFVLIFILARRYEKWAHRRRELGTIVPEYLPPKNASIQTASSIVRSHVSFSAQLIDLAVRHYVRLYEVKPKRFLTAAVYEIEIIKDSADLRDEEKEFLNDLFNGQPGVGAKITTNDMKKDHGLGIRLQDNPKKLQTLMREKYGLQRRDETMARWFRNASLVLLIASLLLLSPFLLIVAVVAFAMSFAIWPLTDKGLALYRYLEGLKMYIGVAEAERLKMLQSPEGAAKAHTDGTDQKQLIKLYEKTLPYAMLFGQEKEWNKRLGEYYESTHTQPDWYTGATLASFSAASFSSAMSNLTTSISSTGASSSSSGGSSGGGSSGGGGGGGGGGGW